jgi:hypothetical protein
MARTLRNKNTVPVGWTVRDNGCPYFLGNDKWGRDNNLSLPEYRRSIYRCEVTGARREHNRRYRTRMNHLVRTGRWEDIFPPTRTSGWESW